MCRSFPGASAPEGERLGPRSKVSLRGYFVLNKMSANTLTLAVAPEHSGQRLDRFVAVQLPALSRSRIQSLIEEGRVSVDGAVRKASHRVQTGESITVEIAAPRPAGVEAEPIPLEVLYEDEDVAVINKPAGMIVHPGAGADSGRIL